MERKPKTDFYTRFPDSYIGFSDQVPAEQLVTLVAAVLLVVEALLALQTSTVGVMDSAIEPLDIRSRVIKEAVVAVVSESSSSLSLSLSLSLARVCIL